MRKEISEPAFPQSWHPDMMSDPTLTPAGMTLRDYFAAKALEAIVNKFPAEQGEVTKVEWQHKYDAAARGAYAYADSMLKERAK